MLELEMIKNIFLASLVIILFLIEIYFPYFENFKFKTRHAFRNILIIVFNNVIVLIVFVPLILAVTDNPYGIFNQIMIPTYLEIIATILIIDCLTYWMHVAYHNVPFLWQFHKMHHSDTEMDVTTGARFHIGEIAISTVVRIAFYGIFAMRMEYIILYETLSLISIFFHHSNISIGDKTDKIYRIFFTSPDMHKVHHSRKKEETNSNYTSLFSFWDRLFGSYKIVKNPKKIQYGINGLDSKQTFLGMLGTPFTKEDKKKKLK